MPDSYTMLWTTDYCKYLTSVNEIGKPLRFVWGGHNQSTRFSHYKIKEGDYIYPIRVYKGDLYIIARMKIKQIIKRDNYLDLHPEDEYLIRHSCANEVLAGEEGHQIRLDIKVSPEILERLHFRSQSKERGLKYITDGKLKSHIGLDGIYRLSIQSAKDFDTLLKASTPFINIKER
jgi:hypothetical protein